MSWRDFERAQRVVELDDRFIAYVDEGRGDPVVLVHGIPTWGFVWQRVLPELARARRVIVPDLLGYGFSDKADRFDRSIARLARASSGRTRCQTKPHVGIPWTRTTGSPRPSST